MVEITVHFAAKLVQLSFRRGHTVSQLIEAVAARLAADEDRAIKAVAVVHNETSTGVTSDIAAVREAIDGTDHPALLLVDVISSLGSIDYRHDEWGADVTVHRLLVGGLFLWTWVSRGGRLWCPEVAAVSV